MILELNEPFSRLAACLIWFVAGMIGGMGLPDRWNPLAVAGAEMAVVLLLTAPIRVFGHVLAVGVFSIMANGIARAVADWWKPDPFWRWVCLLVGVGLAVWGIVVWPDSWREVY